MAKEFRSGTRFMSDSSIRVKPSIDEPSNWISPSRAFSNCERGISTFLMTPRMSVNWSRMNRTFSAPQTFRISGLDSPGPEASNFRIFALAILLSFFCNSGAILMSFRRNSTGFEPKCRKNLRECTILCAFWLKGKARSAARLM